MKKSPIIMLIALLILLSFSGCVEQSGTSNTDTKYVDNTKDASSEMEKESDDNPDDLAEMIFGDDSYLRITFEVKTWAAYATAGNMYASVNVKNKYWAPCVSNPMQIFQFSGKNVELIIKIDCEGKTSGFTYKLGDVSSLWTTYNTVDIDFDNIKKSEYNGGPILWTAWVRESGSDYGGMPDTGSFTMTV